MSSEFGFFKTTMPASRPAGYYIGCLDGCIFIDFDDCDDGLVRLRRISFDGYGCCDLFQNARPLDKADSDAFKEIMKKPMNDDSLLAMIVTSTISVNRQLIWEDALKEYGLI